MDRVTQQTLFSPKTGEWATPQDFFDKLNWRLEPNWQDIALKILSKGE